MNNASTTPSTYFFIACLLYVSLAPTHAATYPLDSVGIERKDGKRYIIHRVDQGQTLFAVGRRYNVNIEDIKRANPDLSDGGVRYDQLLRVPVPEISLSRRELKDVDKAIRKEEKEKAKAAKDAQRIIADSEADEKADAKAQRRDERREEKFTKENDGIHLVTTGQTLYSLAVRYNVTMADIRAWNNLGADGIQVGQRLIVSAKAAEAKGIATTTKAKSTNEVSGRTATSGKQTAEAAPPKLESKPLVAPEPPLAPGSKPKPKPMEHAAEPKKETKPEVKAEPREARAEPKEVKAEPKAEPKKEKEEVTAASEPVRRETVKKADPETSSAKAGRVHSDMGFADVIEGNDASTKYLALHRSAPVGTLVQVRNDINNQSLYVKVIGKLPDTGINDQVLIRLSGRAFEKLSPNGQRFRAEVSYTK